jgi:hypothetical protein
MVGMLTLWLIAFSAVCQLLAVICRPSTAFPSMANIIFRTVMAEVKKSAGSIILNGKQADYFLQWDGASYLDLQVRWARPGLFEKTYDHSFILSDGGEGIRDCDKKFPGLRPLLAKRYPDLGPILLLQTSLSLPLDRNQRKTDNV